VGEDLGSGNFAKSVDAMAASGPRDIWAFGAMNNTMAGYFTAHYDGKR
jgi:hypothetical protein